MPAKQPTRVTRGAHAAQEPEEEVETTPFIGDVEPDEDGKGQDEQDGKEETAKVPSDAEARYEQRKKAKRYVNPRLAAELPVGIPMGADLEGEGSRKPYKVLCAFVLDDEGVEVPQGEVVLLSEGLADRYLGLSAGYGERTRPLIQEAEEE